MIAGLQTTAYLTHAWYVARTTQGYNMGNTSKIMSFKQPTIKQQVHFSKLFDKCQKLTLEHIEKILRRMFDHADDALFALAEKTDSTTDSTAYFDSMRIIRLKRSEIEKQHFNFIKQAFADIKNNKALAKKEEKTLDSFSVDDLSLIEDADLEENIAIKNIVSKISHHCAQELSHIEKRLSHILSADVDALNNPLGPNVICNTFMQAATALDIELKVSLIILKLFDQEIVSGLSPLLTEANNLFIAANVLPDFKHTIQKSAHVDSPYQAQNNSTENPQDEHNPPAMQGGGDYTQTHQPQAYPAQPGQHPQQQYAAEQYSNAAIGANPNGTVQDTSIAHFHELLSRQQAFSMGPASMMPINGVAPGDNVNMASANNVHPIMASQSAAQLAGAEGSPVANTNTVTSPQFVGSLTQLQNIPLSTMLPAGTVEHNIEENEDGSHPLQATGNLKQFVIQHLQQQDANFSVNDISPLDQDVIDVVSMLFDFILEDKNIPDAAKAHIARLQIPLLKAAIIDKEFFSANKNAARNLLNELAHAALGIFDEEEPASKALLAEIERVVDTINNDFEDDLNLFEAQLDTFKTFMAQHEHKEATANNKIQRKIKRKEDNALAYQWVEDTVDEILQDKHLPDIIIDLIRGPWKKVMLNTYLNNGQNSDTWKNQVRFIDVLEWSIQPKHETLDRQKLANIIGQLVLTLRNGLQVINVSPEETQNILAQLEPFHLASIKGMSVKEYQASLKPDTAFLFSAESSASTENDEEISEHAATEVSEVDSTNDLPQDSDFVTAHSDASETPLSSHADSNSEESTNDQSYLSENAIVLEEIEYEADENYESNLSLDEIDQTILKMEQDLLGLEELANSLNTAATSTHDAINEESTEESNIPVLNDPITEPTAEEAMEDDFILLGDEEAFDESDDNFNKLITEDIILSGFSSEQANAPKDQPQDEYLELARHLEQGKWVEFLDDNNHKTRAKLAWKSELLGEYTFLNWKFDVVADKTLYGLAADLRRGTATIIDDIPLVDRALSAVMSSLTPTNSSSQKNSSNTP